MNILPWIDKDYLTMNDTEIKNSKANRYHALIAVSLQVNY